MVESRLSSVTLSSSSFHRYTPQMGTSTRTNQHKRILLARLSRLGKRTRRSPKESSFHPLQTMLELIIELFQIGSACAVIELLVLSRLSGRPPIEEFPSCMRENRLLLSFQIFLSISHITDSSARQFETYTQFPNRRVFAKDLTAVELFNYHDYKFINSSNGLDVG